MAMMEEEPVKRSRAHEIGQDLALLSVEELAERIELLRSEIERLDEEMQRKGKVKSAAEALFRRL